MIFIISGALLAMQVGICVKSPSPSNIGAAVFTGVMFIFGIILEVKP